MSLTVSPAASSAPCAARLPSSIEPSPGETYLRSSIPLRVRIHSSDVSMIFDRALFGTTFAGSPTPVPVITLFMMVLSCGARDAGLGARGSGLGAAKSYPSESRISNPRPDSRSPNPVPRIPNPASRAPSPRPEPRILRVRDVRQSQQVLARELVACPAILANHFGAVLLNHFGKLLA